MHFALNIFGKHCKQLLGQIVVSAPRGYEIVGKIVGTPRAKHFWQDCRQVLNQIVGSTLQGFEIVGKIVGALCVLNIF